MGGDLLVLNLFLIYSAIRSVSEVYSNRVRLHAVQVQVELKRVRAHVEIA